MHGPVRAPQTGGAGNARVTIAFDSWKDGGVASTQHEIPVVAPRSLSLKLEPVSSRLKGELVHSNKSATIAGVQFSPDGKRVLAGDYPGGVIAVWDVASGKRLTTIDAGYGYHATINYYAVSRDWRTVFAWREKHKAERVEQAGKPMIRWTFGGEVRAWNLEDGKLLRTYKRQPQSNVRLMDLAPDGKTFYTLDELPGTYERRAKQAVSLWDVQAGTYRTLEGLDGYGGLFSPDGNAVVFSADSDDGSFRGINLIDVATGREKWSIPIKEKNTSAWASIFSQNGSLLVGSAKTSTRGGQADTGQCQLKWWDATTGHEVASSACEGNGGIMFPVLSPDGKRVAGINPLADRVNLFLISMQEKRLERTIILCDKTAGQRPIAVGPVFSPDGKWLAVITQLYPIRRGTDPDPREVPQPRILLIETATGAIRETLIAPQCFSNSVCFSPDGRTLATGGFGRVLLWDMTKMPE